MIYRVSTQIELGNLTGAVLQVDIETEIFIGDMSWSFSIIVAYLCLGAGESLPTANLSSTSYFVACTLNATTTATYLSMQDGRTALTPSLPFDNDLGAWTIWSPGTITNLTKGASVLILH